MRPPSPPGQEEFWVASVEGSGDQSLLWEPESGNWAVVIMNADGRAGVSVDVRVGGQVGLGLRASASGCWLPERSAASLGATLLVVGVVGLARGAHIDLTGAEDDPGNPSGSKRDSTSP